MRILTVAEMQALEREADAAGHSYRRMMEQAGQGITRALLRRAAVKGRRILILVGPGNNGGDGLVAGRLLRELGAEVTAYLSQPRDAADDPVFEQAQSRSVRICLAASDPQQEELKRLVTQAHILIDALLGTGAKPPLRGPVSDILRAVNEALGTRATDSLTDLNTPTAPRASAPLILAVDGPSGMDFDSGAVDALTLKAQLTVTFAAPKWGHLTNPAAALVGELTVADIGIPATIALPEGPEIATPGSVAAILPPRPLDAHKGTFGKALIVAGSSNYTGAAALAAASAVRAGAGLVTLAIPANLHSAIVPLVPEATYLLLPHAVGALDAAATSLLAEHVADYSAVLVGPGLGLTPETRRFAGALWGISTPRRTTGFVRSTPAAEMSANVTQFPPLVIDADGLNLLSEIADWHRRLPQETILTPHPGEMARLSKLSSGEVQARRTEIAQQSAAAWGHVVVLKGAFTVIAAPDGRTTILPFANPALSSAGTGDVLAGAIVALRAQGLGAYEAAVAGSYLHGLAGEIVRGRLGNAGVAASDVCRALPEARCRLQSASLPTIP